MDSLTTTTDICSSLLEALDSLRERSPQISAVESAALLLCARLHGGGFECGVFRKPWDEENVGDTRLAAASEHAATFIDTAMGCLAQDVATIDGHPLLLMVCLNGPHAGSIHVMNTSGTDREAILNDADSLARLIHARAG